MDFLWFRSIVKQKLAKQSVRFFLCHSQLNLYDAQNHRLFLNSTLTHYLHSVFPKCESKSCLEQRIAKKGNNLHQMYKECFLVHNISCPKILKWIHKKTPLTTFFSRVHATLHPAMAVRPSVVRLVSQLVDLSYYTFLSILFLQVIFGHMRVC